MAVRKVNLLLRQGSEPPGTGCSCPACASGERCQPGGLFRLPGKTGSSQVDLGFR